MIIHSIAFGCNKTGDIIQFVQYLFNLSFKEAMQKINEDFNLGLEGNTKIDYRKIRQIEKDRQQKELKKKKMQNCFIELCKKKQKYYEIIKSLEKKINYKNWENIVKKSSDIQMKCELIDLKLDEIDNILSSR